MANHLSAEKRNRQRIVITARGRAVRSHVRSVVAKARVAIAEGADDAAALVQQACSLLDRARSKNALPGKRTARSKSRLTSYLHRAQKG